MKIKRIMDTIVENPEILYADEVHKIIGCAMVVYNTLGRGFLEAVYHDALEVELKSAGIPFEHKKHMNIFYNGVKLPSYYQADVVCYDSIILELKVETELLKEDEAQLIHYLKATGIKLGILINFGKRRKLEWRRIIYSDERYLNNTNIQTSQ